MGSSSEDSDISYFEIDDHEAKSYARLKDGEVKVKYSDSSYRCPFCAGKEEQDYRYKDLLEHATALGQSNRGAKVKANHRALANLLKNDLSNADGLSQTVIEQEPGNPKKEDHFVWPWMGILVINKDRRFFGESGTKMKEELHQFNPLKVHALWSFREHSGKFIVDFSKDWAGFINAMAFEKFFEAKHDGKRDWKEGRHYGLSDMYGWVARDDDYHSRCLIGDHLRKNGDLTTISDLEKRESRKTEKLLSNLKDRIEAMDKKIQELEGERDSMPQAHNEELREVGHRSREISLRIIEKVMLEVERKLNDSKKKLASFEQKKADGNVLMLVEEQKGEKDELVKRMRELERQQDANKQKLELEMDHMKGLLQFIMKDSYQTLTVKEGLRLQDVGKALITGPQDAQSSRAGRIKVDDETFQNVCKPKDDVASEWQEVKKPDWHPFKRRKVDGEDEEVIDEEDERLRGLKDGLGDEAYIAVSSALLEINEYNPSDRPLMHHQRVMEFQEKA